MTSSEHDPPPIEERILGAMQRVGLALELARRQQGAGHGLTSNQARLLALLQRADAMRLQEVSSQLGVTAPTASQTISALARRGLVVKGRDPDDARALEISLTETGRSTAEAVGGWSEDLRQAVLDLPVESLDCLMKSLVFLVRSLGERDRIPVATVCVACLAFRPNAHPGSDKPHHCVMIDRPLAAMDVRFDCPVHEPAPPEQAAAAWRAVEDS